MSSNRPCPSRRHARSGESSTSPLQTLRWKGKPIRGDGAEHFVHFQRALWIYSQIRQLLVPPIQVHFDRRTKKKKRIQPNMMLAPIANRDQSAKLLVGDEPFNYFLWCIGVFVVEDHRAGRPFKRRLWAARKETRSRRMGSGIKYIFLRTSEPQGPVHNVPQS